MKYVMNKYCKGTFNLSKIINLNNFLNQDEQEKFITLRSKKEELTDEEFDWLGEIYKLIKEKSSWCDGIITDYDIDDWDWYPDEDDVIE